MKLFLIVSIIILFAALGCQTEQAGFPADGNCLFEGYYAVPGEYWQFETDTEELSEQIKKLRVDLNRTNELLEEVIKKDG